MSELKDNETSLQIFLLLHDHVGPCFFITFKAQVFVCSQAFKTGIFAWTNPDNSGEVFSYGSGRRGCLRAITASILLSQDSVSSTVDLDPSSGGIKEPLLKLTQLMRGLGFTRSLHHRRTDGMFSGSVGYVKEILDVLIIFNYLFLQVPII